jgi:hypothetical protein
VVLDLSWVHAELAPHYPKIGRPSIDPVLMIRMLITGYVFGIRSERLLCREVKLNMAYRWFFSGASCNPDRSYGENIRWPLVIYGHAKSVAPHRSRGTSAGRWLGHVFGQHRSRLLAPPQGRERGIVRLIGGFDAQASREACSYRLNMYSRKL